MRVMIGGKPAEPLPANEDAEELVLSETAVPARIAPAPAADAAPEEADEVDEAPRRAARILPALAILAVLGWFSAMGWLLRGTFAAPMAPAGLVQLIAALCVPPVLVGILYLLALRTSRAEAQRFGASARAMRAEAASLERVVATLSRKIEENRAALAEQTNILIAMGERASEKLESAAGSAAQHARSIDASTRHLGESAADAEHRVAVVLASLPKAHEEMRGLSDRVDAAGLLAGERAAALDTQLSALAERGREADQIAGGAADRLAAHIARMEATSQTASARLEKVTGEMSTQVDAVLDRAMGDLHAAGTERTGSLAASMSALHGSVAAMTVALDTGDETARRVIGTSEDLLTALDASAREIDETLPEALARLDARINASRQVVAASKPELLALVTAAESTHDAIEAIADVVGQQRDTLAKTQASLLETLATGGEQAEQLGAMVDETIATTRRFAESAAPQLVEALVSVRETSSAAASHARETLSSIVPHAERAIEEAASDALRRAIDVAIRRQLADLAETTEAAVVAATRASERLTQQMVALADTTAQVEARIAEGRKEREDSDSDNFARRVSLLIEALNSASIDITKAFSADVTDSAWSAYLKGDRGVFTRRAVRLLDPSETRDIHRLYEDDADFRDNVNRYIHDFEGMLRQILALRDGSPMGVTLLSSDMGKLYVALAQAIERLRT